MRARPALQTVGRVTGPAALALGIGLLLLLGVGPHTGRYRTMTVLTGSMNPTYPPGSVIVQTPVPVRDVRVGDVITYRIPVEDHRVVTHRIVEIVEGGQHPTVITKGDGNPAPDTWTAKLESDMTWRTRAGVPGLGHVLQALRSPAVRSLALFGLPFLLALLWLKDIWSAPPPAVERPRSMARWVRVGDQTFTASVSAFAPPGPPALLPGASRAWTPEPGGPAPVAVPIPTLPRPTPAPGRQPALT